MKISMFAAGVAVCAMGTTALGQNVVLEGELSTCQNGVNGTFAVTTPGFDGSANEFVAPETWHFYRFYGVAGQVIDIEIDRAVAELDPGFTLWQGDASGIPLADFFSAENSTNGSITFLGRWDDEDPAAVGGGPFDDPHMTGFVLPATGAYTLLAQSTQSASGAASYDYIINMSALGATIDNVTQSMMHPTLQDAVDNADPGDVIQVGAGTLCENVDVNKALTIRGAGMDATVIDGVFADRSVFVDVPGGSDLFRLEGMTLMNGSTGNFGGGLFVDADILITEIVDVRMANNSAASFGGFFKNGALATDSTFLMDGCEIVDNTSGNLGGGGGIAFQSENAVVRNSLFKGNIGTNGAAWYTQTQFDYDLTFANCTFVDHSGSAFTAWFRGNGGTGVYTMSNCVFADNSSTRIDIDGGGQSGTTSNSVLGDGAVLTGAMVDGGGNVTTSPTFEDAAGCDYRLAAGSSGIDMGDMGAYFAAGGGTTDLNGDPRFNNDPTTTDSGTLGSVLDAGCYEHQTALVDVAPCDGDANGDTVIDVNDISYVLFRLGNPCP